MKFTIIRKTIDKIDKIYSKSLREGSKATRIVKIMKTAKFTIIRHTTYKISEIYPKGCREGPLKITKFTKFTKTAKFTIIRHTSYKFNELRYLREFASPSKKSKEIIQIKVLD